MFSLAVYVAVRLLAVAPQQLSRVRVYFSTARAQKCGPSAPTCFLTSTSMCQTCGPRDTVSRTLLCFVEGLRVHVFPTSHAALVNKCVRWRRPTMERLYRLNSQRLWDAALLLTGWRARVRVHPAGRSATRAASLTVSRSSTTISSSTRSATMSSSTTQYVD